MVRNEDMMSIDDVTSILGVKLVGVVPDSEKVIIASNRGEPVVLSDKICLPRTAFENTARRLVGEDLEFLDLNNPESRNPVKRIFRNFIKRTD